MEMWRGTLLSLLLNKQYKMFAFFPFSTFLFLRIWPTLCEESYLFMPKDVTDETVGDGFFLAKKNGEVCVTSFYGALFLGCATFLVGLLQFEMLFVLQ